MQAEQFGHQAQFEIDQVAGYFRVPPAEALDCAATDHRAGQQWSGDLRGFARGSSLGDQIGFETVLERVCARGRNPRGRNTQGDHIDIQFVERRERIDTPIGFQNRAWQDDLEDISGRILDGDIELFGKRGRSGSLEDLGLVTLQTIRVLVLASMHDEQFIVWGAKLQDRHQRVFQSLGIALEWNDQRQAWHGTTLQETR